MHLNRHRCVGTASAKPGMSARVRRREKVKEVRGIFNEIVLPEADGCYTLIFFLCTKTAVK